MARDVASALQRAMALHQAGQLAQALQLYTQVLARDPKQFDALHLAGIALCSQGDPHKALELVARAARLKPAHAPVHALHGNILADLGRPEEALACYDKALAVQDSYLDARFNRGNLYMRMRRHADALRDYDSVLGLNAQHLQALNNRGHALQQLERMPDALQSYLAGLALAPDNADLHASIAEVLRKQGLLQEALNHYARALQGGSGFTAQNATLQMALLHYLYGDQAQVLPLLDTAKGMLAGPPPSDDGSLIYCVFLMRICAWWVQQGAGLAQVPADAQPLYVVGESHAFSYHQLPVVYDGKPWRCKSLWIAGCKQWHIGNAQPNHYKLLLQAMLNTLPPGSRIVLAIGEIDCRMDGGILKAWKKSPQASLQDMVQATVDGYLNTVAAMARERAHQLVISGVPAYNLAPPDGYGDIDAFADLLRRFNATLKQAALARGMDFLDLFALTDGGNARSNQQWHIDGHHLRPDGMAQAFARHLIRTGGPLPAGQPAPPHRQTSLENAMHETALVIQQPEAPAQQLILLLHAAGSTPDAMAPLGRRLRLAFPNAAIVCLQAQVPMGEGDGFEWFIQLGELDKDIAYGVGEAMPALLEDIRGWQARTALDDKATALIGFAQGGIMALEAGNQQPGVASRIIAIAGRFAILPAAAPAVTTIHFLHGKSDDTIPYRHTVEAAHHLLDLGTDITAEVIPFVGHELSEELMDKVVDKLTTHIPQRVWEEAQRQAPEGAEGG